MTRSKPFIIAILIASLALAQVSRRWAQSVRDTAIIDPLSGRSGGAPTQSSGDLVKMDSYALALLLGGLRGPLVMFLWSSSESQKSQHDLEDFDTKVEWIRLLQPEFDTVHLFQIWNKAYNVSALMANLPNKYSTILDAIDYADRVDRERPDDINIVDQMGNVFGEKLGGDQLPAEERDYYYGRVTQETQAPHARTRITIPNSELDSFVLAARAAGMDEPEQTAESDDEKGTITIILRNEIAQALEKQFTPRGAEFAPMPRPRGRSNQTVVRDRLEPMLDEEGNILPELLKPTHPRPTDLATDAPWYDGSNLQFLAPYQPFPYGLSPNALGYNFHKRTQMLQLVDHEEHIQNTPYIVDSRPGLALKSWAAESGLDGRRAELRYFGMDDHGDRLTLEPLAPGAGGANTPIPPVTDPAAGPRALHDYALAGRLYDDSHTEILDHLRRFPNGLGVLSSHLDDDVAFAALYKADHDFLDGLLFPERRKDSWASAAVNYAKARDECVTIVLDYYVDADMQKAIFPMDPVAHVQLLPEEVRRLPAEQQRQIFQKLMSSADDFYKKRNDEHGDERNEYAEYASRCNWRLQLIGAAK